MRRLLNRDTFGHAVTRYVILQLICFQLDAGFLFYETGFLLIGAN